MLSVLVLALVLVLASCSGCSVPQVYVQADRATYEVVAPEYLEYLSKDEALDPKVREARALLIQSWDLRLRKAEGR